MIELPEPVNVNFETQGPWKCVLQKYTPEQLRTYGDQRAAEAREQMREECLRICDEVSKSAWKEWKLKYDPHQQGLSMGADACKEAIKELK